ncbi:hypothetical protein NQ318_009919 [Aromia moschata]|uniref:Uncharacterized protein n=1 Tax=Aromia moschata TaxID=1265417 RepID=A0AAV8YAE3_9CUCU|nr:hypothetical protein NQ318_009919 [Aromia moschata]
MDNTYTFDEQTDMLLVLGFCEGNFVVEVCASIIEDIPIAELQIIRPLKILKDVLEKMVCLRIHLKHYRHYVYSDVMPDGPVKPEQSFLRVNLDSYGNEANFEWSVSLRKVVELYRALLNLCFLIDLSIK